MMPDIDTLKFEGLHHDNALQANAPPPKECKGIFASSAAMRHRNIVDILPTKEKGNNESQKKTLVCSRWPTDGVIFPRSLRRNACSIA